MGQWAALALVVVWGLAAAGAGKKRRRFALALWAVGSVGLLLAAAGPYELRKTVAVLLMPLGLVWAGCAFLAVRLGRSGNSRGAVGAWVLFLALGLVGSVPAGVVTCRWLEAPFAGGNPLAAGPFDAVVVLGGDLGVDDVGSPTLGWSGERVALGARLYLAGRTELLAATGPWVRRGGTAVSVAEATRDYWSMLGVPPEGTLAFTGPRTTRDEILRTAREARARGWKRVGLVSSAWHLRRATRLARRAGLQVTPLAADRLGIMPPGGIRYAIPQAAGVMRTEHAAWELLGMLAGR